LSDFLAGGRFQFALRFQTLRPAVKKDHRKWGMWFVAAEWPWLCGAEWGRLGQAGGGE
jgi:hypothetical protein